MKMETDIWTVKEGELKEIKLNDEIFTVEKKRKETKQATLDQFGMFLSAKPVHVGQVPVIEKVKEPTIIKKGKPLGKKIGTYGTNTINLNVFNDVRKWIDKGLDKPAIAKKLHEIYKPHTKIESCNALASFYMRYVRGLKPKQKKGKERGKRVGSMKNNSIYEKPYNEVKDAIESGKKWSYIRDNIIKSYYPNYTIYSLNSMTSMYKKFAQGYGDRPKTRRYRKRRKPKNFFDKSKTYIVNVTKNDVLETKRAIILCKLNYKPTFDSLLKETKMPINKLRGILDVMKKHDMIEIKKDGLTKIYRLKE
jgi:hypothetical protein